MILLSTSLGNCVRELTYEAAYKTDHKAIKMQINWGNAVRGPGNWKFNNLLLHDKSFLDKCNQKIKEIEEMEFADPADRWEYCKIELAQIALKHAKMKAVNEKSKLRNLMKKLEELENTIVKGKGEHLKRVVTHTGAINRQIEVIMEKCTAAHVF